ncbi:MAG: hypothetical protein IKK26_06485 [Clostridia bacterium]|nr:hypothetical protein [Clostridia bacterium]
MSKKIQKKEGNGAKKALKIVACILVAVIILGVLGVYTVLSSGVIEKNTVAAKTENYTVTTAMLNYLYNTNYQNLVTNAGSYLEALGLDTKKPLDEQKYAGDDTWHDYMLDSTRSQLTDALVLCEAALAAGCKLDDEDKADIDETLETIAKYAEQYNVSKKFYIKNVYGSSVTENDIRSCLEILSLAEKYQTELVDTYDYDAEDWAAYFAENEKDFLKVDYLTYTFEAEKEDDKKDDKKDSETTADKTKAGEETTAAEETEKEPVAELGYAEELAATTDADSFKAYVKNYLENVKYANLTEEELKEDKIDIEALVEGCLKEAQTTSGSGDLAKWLADDARHAYDVYTDFNEKDGKYTVYMILPAQNDDLDYNCKYRETYLLKDYRYIPVAISSTEKDKTKAMEEAKKIADKILKEYNDNATDENFAKLADPANYGDGYYEGGLVEAADKGTMNEQVSEWVFAEDRKAGDVTIIEVEEQGYYVLYFKGDNTTSWEHDADTALKNDQYSKDYEGFKEAHKVTYYKKGVELVKSL